jgi:hypothetical protein
MRAPALCYGGNFMSNVDKYEAHARHCMDKAAQAQHAQDKRSWLLLAETWLDLIPGHQRVTAEPSAAAIRNQETALRTANLHIVR